MRPSVVVLFILTLISVYAAQSDCPTCDELTGRPRAELTAMVNGDTKTLEVTAFYENLTASPSRQPIPRTVLLLELTSPTANLNKLYRLYTDSNGKAAYVFSADSTSNPGACINFKVIYCPFCLPESSSCGFAACLNYSRIRDMRSAYSNIGGPGKIDSPAAIPVALGSTVPSPVNPDKYLPQATVANYCPPPPPLGSTPALCLPLIMIFSLLSGALYVSGHNPFAGFNLGGARVGRHIRYQARGRGFSVSAMAVASAVSTVAGAAKTIKEGGMKGLAKQEKAAASMRTFGLGSIKGAVAGVKALKSSRAVVTAAKTKAAAAKAKEAAAKGLTGAALEKASKLTLGERIKIRGETVARHIEARLGGGEKTNLKSQEVGSKPGFMPVTGGVVRGSELLHVSKAKTGVGQYFGTLGGTFGKALVFMLMNSQPMQLIEAFRYAFIPRDQYKSFSEMIFVDHDKRAANDNKAMQELLATGGVVVRLPNGQIATLVGFETTVDGKRVVTFAVDKAKAETADGELKVTFKRNGNVESVSCIAPSGEVIMLKKSANKGELPSLLVAAGGEKADFKNYGPQPGPGKAEAEKLAWAKQADGLYAALGAAGLIITKPGLLVPWPDMGGDMKGLMKQCRNNLEALGAINQSFGTEIDLSRREMEKKILKSYPPEQQKAMLAEGQGKLASEAMALVLGRMASAEEFMTLKTSPFHDPGKLGATVASDAGFNKDAGFTQQQGAAVGSALGSVISGKSVAEISALAQNPEQFKALLLPALVSQGISKPDALNLLNENAVRRLAGGITAAVHDNAKAPVLATAHVMEQSQLGAENLAGFLDKFGKNSHFSEEQRNDKLTGGINGKLSQLLSNYSLAEVASQFKDPAKAADIKAMVADAIVSNLTSRFVKAGASPEDANKAAVLTVQQATSLDLKKDPFTTEGKKLTPAVSEAISAISMQFIATGMKRHDAEKEAESLIRGMMPSHLGSMASDLCTGLSKAAQTTLVQLDKEGFGKLGSEFKTMDISQLYTLASVKRDVAPADESDRARQFADVLARSVKEPTVPEKIKGMLQERESVLTQQMYSDQIKNAFESWSPSRKNSEISIPELSGLASLMGKEYANSINAAITNLAVTDKTFKKYDRIDQDTGTTAAQELAAASATQAENSRFERAMGTNPLATPEQNVETLAKNELGMKGQLKELLETGDLGTAQAICAQQVKYYREIGDKDMANGWNKALEDVAGLKRQGATRSDSEFLGGWIMDGLAKPLSKPILENEQQQRAKGQEHIQKGELDALIPLCKGQAQYYKEFCPSVANAWEKAAKDFEDIKKEGAKPSDVTLLGGIIFENLEKSFGKAENEQPQRDKVLVSIKSGDLDAAQSLCVEQAQQYRAFYPAAAKAWEDAAKSIDDIKGTKPQNAVLLGNTLTDNIEKSFGKAEDLADALSAYKVAAFNVNYLEAQKGLVTQHMDNALNHIEAILATAPPVPSEAPKKGGGGGEEPQKPPPETPPSKPEQPPLAERSPEMQQPRQPEQPTEADLFEVKKQRQLNADLQNPESMLYTSALADADKNVRDARGTAANMASNARDEAAKLADPVLRGEAVQAGKVEFVKKFEEGLEKIVHTDIPTAEVRSLVSDAQQNTAREISRIVMEYGDKINSAPVAEKDALEAEKREKLDYAKTHRPEVELDFLTKGVMERYGIKEDKFNEVKESLRDTRANANSEFVKARDETYQQLTAEQEKRMKGKKEKG